MSESNRPRSIHAWFTAWEARMAAHGYPRARMVLNMDQVGFNYGWTHDIDALATSPIDTTPEAWETAHRALAELDHLRPAFIPRSEALREWMERELREWTMEEG